MPFHPLCSLKFPSTVQASLAREHFDLYRCGYDRWQLHRLAMKRVGKEEEREEIGAHGVKVGNFGNRNQPI